MSPGEGPDRILENNYANNRSNKVLENIEWVVGICISELLVHKVDPRLCGTRDIYRNNFPMYLIQVSAENTSDRNLAPSHK